MAKATPKDAAAAPGRAPAPARPVALHGIAIFGDLSAQTAQDPQQKAVDDAVAAHNAAVLARLEASRAATNRRAGMTDAGDPVQRRMDKAVAAHQADVAAANAKAAAAVDDARLVALEARVVALEGAADAS